ncbi:protein translocase subunit SecF [Phosphitispora fastidiosa]|uniref:protein translocase subunit SecF n=1 Tax=Phosphitispora fastidiosa TaxID=2837202 RepID=UPI001E2D0E58|nr:protein translocase subunit SecF [Phosphitispora fastidiosa]MBU7007873.1 preprotein translocase subunit SecF [Phosphitispora fastidiosa]
MDIVGRRKIWFAISLLVIIPGLISMAFKWVTLGSPLNLGIEFTGGNLINIEFKSDVTVAQLRDVLKEVGLEKSSIQMSGSRAAIIRTVVLDDKKQADLMSLLKEKIGPYDEEKLSISKIGPTIGKELTRNAILALLIAAALMVAYISYRFEFRFGISAIVALLHDVFITLGLFSIFWWEVDSTFVAAILTIIGYSINDTIVIFDRIRENLNKRKKGEDLEQMVNKSILQTLVRSINTVLTVVFILLALLVYGGATIKIFTLALLIGVVSGAYSSIFNASPMWVMLKGMEKGRA